MSRLPGLPQSEGDAQIIAEGFARIGAGGALPGFLAVVEQWRPELLVHECYEFAGPIAAERHGVRTARVALGLASTEDWVTRAGRARRRGPAGREVGPGGRPGRAATLLSIVPPGLDDGPAERFRDGAPPAAAAPRATGGRTPTPRWSTSRSDRWRAHCRPSTPASTAACSRRWSRWRYASCSRSAVTPTPRRSGPLPANAHAEPWVSQHDVLPHAAAVVSHAGYGTTLGALEHGVAHVMLPLFAGDQWRTARRVAQLGAGLQLEEGERRVFDPPQAAVIAALPEAVRRVLEEARFAEVARSLGAEMAGLPPADAAAAALVRALDVVPDHVFLLRCVGSEQPVTEGGSARQAAGIGRSAVPVPAWSILLQPKGRTPSRQTPRSLAAAVRAHPPSVMLFEPYTTGGYTSTTTGSTIGRRLQALVDELGEVVVQHLLQQVDLADLLARGARQRGLDRVADLVEQLVGVVGIRHAAEDHLGLGDRRAVLLGDRRDDDEDAVGAEHAPVAQGDVGRVADVDAVDEDHPRPLGLAEARAAAVELERQPVLALEDVVGVDAHRLGELRRAGGCACGRRGTASRSAA